MFRLAQTGRHMRTHGQGKTQPMRRGRSCCRSVLLRPMGSPVTTHFTSLPLWLERIYYMPLFPALQPKSGAKFFRAAVRPRKLHITPPAAGGGTLRWAYFPIARKVGKGRFRLRASIFLFVQKDTKNTLRNQWFLRISFCSPAVHRPISGAPNSDPAPLCLPAHRGLVWQSLSARCPAFERLARRVVGALLPKHSTM